MFFEVVPSFSTVAWCFGVAKGAFWGLAAPPLATRPAAAAGAAAAVPAAAIAVPSFSSMVFRCGEGCNRFVFTRIQKGRQAPGQHVFGGRSVLQGHGVLLFRDCPLGLCCGAALRAWELHFGAGFLLVQKAPLGTTSSSSSSTTSSSSRPSSCKQQAQQLQSHFVFTRIQKGRQAPGQHFLEVVPSFRAMVFCCFATAR